MANILKTGVCRTSAAYRPAPSLFYFPGLTSKPWHDPADFAWAKSLRKNFPLIKAEYLAIREAKLESDYLVGQGEHTLHQGKWDWFSYVTKGAKQPRFARHCPTTAALLDAIPSFMSDGIPFAFAFFSTLESGGSIAPHCAPANLRLRCHLPLIVPEGCSIRVAGETREWREGEPMVFDDSFEHEVKHEGEGDRVVLLFDTWHPDLTAGEVREICAMFDHARAQGWMQDPDADATTSGAATA